MGTMTNRAFPANNIIFDMSDNISSLGPDSLVYERCIDKTSDGITGTIDYFKAELIGSASQVSTSTPVSIPDYNVAAYATLSLKQGVIINPPVPTSPANGSTVNSLTPTLEVQAITDAIQYHFCVYQNSSLMAEGYSTSNTWAVGINLTNNTTYTWDCQVQKSSGWSSYFTPRWSFTVSVPMPPSAPTPVSPSNNSTVTVSKPTLQVQTITDATQYHFRVYQNSIFITEGYSTINSWTVNIDLSNGTYTWDCQAENSLGWGAYFSPQWAFTVGLPTPPNAPTPSSPANNSIVTTLKPTLKVVKVNGTSQYHFRLFLNGNMVSEKYTTSNSWKMSSNLQNNTTYTWDCQIQKNGLWSAYFTPAWSFRVQARVRSEQSNIIQD
jgi:hypothetical protein